MLGTDVYRQAEGTQIFVAVSTDLNVSRRSRVPIVVLDVRVQCWCGDDDDYARHGASDGCTMACSGAPGEICGGSFAMNVYES